MILKNNPIAHPQLNGVLVYPIGDAKRGEDQQILVVMNPGVAIPLHQHSVDATMFVVAGEATLLSENEHNGRKVGVGDRVEFARLNNHGFVAGENGMSFMSFNGGIVDPAGWDMQFA